MRTKPAVLLLASLMASPAHPSTLQEQAICAAQAEATFKKDGYKKFDPTDLYKKDHPADDARVASFMSHYDAANQLCLIGVEEHKQFGQTGWTYKIVYDAIGGQTYGSYTWHTVEEKKYWEVPPFECHITTFSGERIDCKDDDEFDELSRKNFGIFFK